jgi:ubiquinone/menaquinone biosynthesis C-methylase UbiE
MAQTTAPVRDTWSATEYNNTASFVYSDAFTQPVLDLLQPRIGERIVDFGCGSGEVTKALIDVVGPTGLVLGLDSSENMVNTEPWVDWCRCLLTQMLY